MPKLEWNQNGAEKMTKEGMFPDGLTFTKGNTLEKEKISKAYPETKKEGIARGL